jgi:cell division protein FtsA
MALPPIVAVEIGTTKVVALVGEMRDEGHIVISGIGEHSSSGIRKGEVTDFDHALVCVRGALAGAEETSQVTIHQVHVALSGGHVESMVSRGTIPIAKPAEGVTDDDVEQVTEVARAVNLQSDRKVLHSIGQIFYVDGERVGRPEGFEGGSLALDMLVLHAKASNYRNIIRLLQEIPMEVADVAFGGLCSALAVLTPEQKEGGVLVIDFGGGTTTYTAYAAGTFALSGALRLGGDHVTNDVALAFNIPRSQAERLKRDSGSAVAEESLRGARVDLPPEVGYPARSVSLAGLHTVMHLRMTEILNLILHDVERQGILHQLGAGIVLTGGGAQMKGLIKLTERVFRLPCMVGRPLGFSGLAAVSERPEYSAAAGLIRYAFINASREARSASPITRAFKKLFGAG